MSTPEIKYYFIWSHRSLFCCSLFYLERRQALKKKHSRKQSARILCLVCFEWNRDENKLIVSIFTILYLADACVYLYTIEYSWRHSSPLLLYNNEPHREKCLPTFSLQLSSFQIKLTEKPRANKNENFCLQEIEIVSNVNFW